MPVFGSDPEAPEPYIDESAFFWARASIMSAHLADVVRDVETTDYELSCALFEAGNCLEAFADTCESEAKHAGIEDVADFAKSREDDTLEALAAQVGLACSSKAYDAEIARIHEIAARLDMAASSLMKRAA